MKLTEIQAETLNRLHKRLYSLEQQIKALNNLTIDEDDFDLELYRETFETIDAKWMEIRLDNKILMAAIERRLL